MKHFHADPVTDFSADANRLEEIRLDNFEEENSKIRKEENLYVLNIKYKAMYHKIKNGYTLPWNHSINNCIFI
ncbi:hypothetical protein A4D02_05025 [Niastella koreensis]|uniref:Uncharacterized protein n=2 Tax=Niastella koreensis TaxID=354356 RepID=G8T7U2_NIAKG|nr:hypothetical protein Niako_7169 [Niastella koreensis GR20-10]OQP55666.1 hypothetical protein A4D02_05025 [Niastella koreensis]